LLRRVRAAAAGAYAHEDVPFERIVRALNPGRDSGHHPVFQVLFGFQELEAGRLAHQADGLATTGTAKFDLSLTLFRAADGVRGILEYASDLFDQGSMGRVAERFRRMARAHAAEPGRPLASLPLCAEDQAWCASGRRSPPAPPAGLGVGPASPAAEASPNNSGNRVRDDVERRIAAVWAEVLGHDRFRVDQNFFEVGGHSLAATFVMARVGEIWEVDVPVESIFTTPTIEALARLVVAAPAPGNGACGEGPGSPPPLRRAERPARLPLSFAQERLWFLDQLNPGLPVYNIPFAIPLAGALDVSALERSLERLGERHECLRARFLAGAAGPEQVLDPVLMVQLAVTDLSRFGPASRRTEAERLVARQARHYFDLASGPLLHAHLVRLSAREHVLLLTVHHIVADALSIDVLKRDLAALYEAEEAGTPDNLPELPLQYADFAIWQRAWLTDQRRAAELDYWRNKLAGAPTLLALPVDRPRPGVQTYAGALQPLALGAGVSAAVRRLAREEQATPFMVLLSVFAAVLGRWGGATDLVVGAPVSGRPRRELEELVGFFSNTLPLRFSVNRRQSFRTFLRQVRDVTLEALTHQDLPFETIVNELQPERTLAHNPLFQAMFAFQPAGGRHADDPNPPGTAAPEGRGGLGAASPGSGTAKFDLTLFLVDGEPFHGAVEYRTDLFEAATIERFAAHLLDAAQAAVGSPEEALADLFLAGPSERATVESWNETAASFEGADALAGTLVAEQAARGPDRPAVSMPSETWTYAELLRHATGLARRLRELGVEPDSRVAISAEPSAHLVAATVGVWLAGAACVPLDPSYPPERLAFMASDSGARWLITTRPDDPVAPGLVVVDPLRDARAGHPAVSVPGGHPSAAGGSPDQLAYVVYTSGSTGRPKGVAMTHRALVNLILWQRGRDGHPVARRTLQFASPSFDVFFQEVLLCLATGGELVIGEPDVRRDPALLIEFCRERRVERLFLPFVALREVAEVGSQLAPLPALREVITAGEQLQVTPALRRWFSAHPSCRLLNQYGPSETHVVTEESLAKAPAGWGELPPIGRAVANARAYVLDDELRPLPVGVPGELYLGGVCLARGYLDRPALTAERFLPDSCAPGPGARAYRSGDRARWLPDGRIEFLGRGDDQVKVRGYRVEPAEVEAALARLPGVRQAVVAALPDGAGTTRLVGYVLAEDPAPDPAQLRAALLRLLPEPLVPATFTFVDEFPRTPSGKIDRRSLPVPRAEAAAVCPPSNEIERVIAACWREALGLEQVGTDDNFFSLGGHSLKATQVAVRLRQRLNAEVPVRLIFEHPTVSRLAAALAGAGPTATPDPEAATRDVKVLPRDGSAFPASFAQERMWFLDQLAPGSPAYNLASASALPPSLNVDALKRGLDELLRRHEALRTVLRTSDGRPVQVIAPASRAPLEIVDLSHLGAYEAEAEARSCAEEESRRPFDLSAGPLFRATLIDVGSRGFVLVLAMHHVVSDAWSLRVLHRDLVASYEAFERGGVPSLPPLRVQYADYAAWQRGALGGQAAGPLVSFWRERLAGAPQRLELPADRPRGRARAFRGLTHSFEIAPEPARRIRALARDEGATLFMAALAVFMEWLRRYSGQDDLLVGTPVGARPQAELEGVVGLFVNTLVLRGNLSGNPSFRDLLRRVREEALAAFAHADLPFERLVEELQPRRDLGFNPLVQVAFGLHHEPTDQRVAAGSPAAGAKPHSGNGTSKFELSLMMAEAAGRLSAVLEYDRDLFDPATIARMAAQFETLLGQAAANPDVPLSGWGLTSPLESRQVETTWARGPEVPAESGLAELVARHAERDPEKIAVEAPDGSLTYAELDRQTSRLANALRSLGVVRETPVGVCLGNTLHLPVAFLAVLKSGGVYVPLDPALPRARLAYLVRDAGVRLVIGDRPSSAKLGSCGAVVFDADVRHPGPHPGSDVPADVDPDQLAYVIYTSGSTGQPKGVMATHRGLRALVAAQSAAIGLGPADRVLKFATPSFDAAVFELTLALAPGATLCLEAQDDLLPGPGLVERLRKLGITMVTLPPSSLGVLPAEECPALRVLFVAGEVCPAELVTRWARGRRMINGYGPTETTVWATSADCVPDGRTPAIGRPVANASARILDRHLRPVPVGVPGELSVGGPSVARGYLGRPDLTAARFVPDPWGPPGARAYRTGDLARWRDDGTIDFLGRLDGQVKLRGVRIEPGEVEAAIMTTPGVAFSAVVLREPRPGDPALVAYVVPAPGARLDGADVRRVLREQLPRQSVPSRIVICPELPRTPSGKLDRASLPDPPENGEETPTPPQGSVEETVCRVCSDVLRVPVNRTDNFFELGGHSLLVTRVLARLRDELGADVPVRRMFEAATLAEFCDGLEIAPARPRPRVPRLPRRTRLAGPPGVERDGHPRGPEAPGG
jgi:amino acid adenylation domain-containing protein